MDFNYSFLLKNKTSDFPLILSIAGKLLECERDSANQCPVTPKDLSKKVEELRDTLIIVFRLNGIRGIQIIPELLKAEFQKYLSSTTTDDQAVRVPELQIRTRHHYKLVIVKIKGFVNAVKLEMTTKTSDRNFIWNLQSF